MEHAQDRHVVDDGPQSEARLVLPHLQLDDLLDEVQARLEDVRATRDRVHALLEAVVAIGAELNLESVLSRIVQAAAGLAGARYAALGVLTEDGDSLARFITVVMAQ